jgi:hypothetical protein
MAIRELQDVASKMMWSSTNFFDKDISLDASIGNSTDIIKKITPEIRIT